MWLFRKKTQTPLIPVKSAFSLKQRIFLSGAKLYTVDVELERNGKVLGKIPMTVKAYSKAMVEKKIVNEITLKATNIHFKKQNTK